MSLFGLNKKLSRKKVVVIGCARNEADIIELFVRYTLSFADHLILIDNNSVDGTREILGKLVKEGLQLDLIIDDSKDFPQAFYSKFLLRRALEKYRADWVLQLDIDEFLYSKENKSLRKQILSLPGDRASKIAWRTYVPGLSDTLDQPNLLKRVAHRRKKESSQFYKVILPARFVKESAGRISVGAHEYLVETDGEPRPVECSLCLELLLGHFPVRSPKQIQLKTIAGWLSRRSNASWQEGDVFQVEKIYRELLSNNLLEVDDANMRENVQMWALNYLEKDNSSLSELEHDPIVLPKSAKVLKYSADQTISPLQLLMQVAEELAQDLHEARGGSATSRVENPSIKAI